MERKPFPFLFPPSSPSHWHGTGVDSQRESNTDGPRTGQRKGDWGWLEERRSLWKRKEENKFPERKALEEKRKRRKKKFRESATEEKVRNI